MKGGGPSGKHRCFIRSGQYPRASRSHVDAGVLELACVLAVSDALLAGAVVVTHAVDVRHGAAELEVELCPDAPVIDADQAVVLVEAERVELCALLALLLEFATRHDIHDVVQCTSHLVLFVGHLDSSLLRPMGLRNHSE